MNELILETATVSMATLFAVTGPIDVAAIFAALTSNASPRQRRHMALRGVLIAASIMLLFALFGEALLRSFGISLAALRTAGGILLLLIGIEMVFARSSGATGATDEETHEAESKHDISVFPLATPLLAGPGAIGAAILLMANTEGNIVLQATVVGSILAVMLFAFFCLLGATQIQRILGVTGMHVVSRVFGVLLTALAVQFLFEGIRQSGLLGN